jgi:MFS family permease
MLRSLARRDILAGFWLFSLPALFAGALEVLVPLRLDDLGATGTAIGAIFLVAAACEAAISPIAGRMSDRRGRLAPIRVGLAGAVVMGVLLPLPDTILLVAAALVLTITSLGTFWAPGMALLSDASDRAGLDQALAFSISNLSWALGHVIGGGAGAALADATADAVVYGLLAAASALTLAVALTRGSSARATSQPAGRA